MNQPLSQVSLNAFFAWVQFTLDELEIVQCDESTHYYVDNVFIGGFAGDRREFFVKDNETSNEALRKFANAQR